MPVCGPDDVIVRNVRAGICGTDVTGYVYGGRSVGIFPNSEFGHEMRWLGMSMKQVKMSRV